MQQQRKNIFFTIIILTILSCALGVFIWWYYSNANRYTKAMQMLEYGALDEAAEEFRALGYYKDSFSLYVETKINLDKATKDYNYAIELIKNCQYQDAVKILEELGNFKDSKEKIETVQELQYTDAVGYFNEKNYEQAYKYFLSLGEYKDSKEKAEISRQKMSADEVKEMAYQVAYKEYGARNYQSALNKFKQLQDYKDSLTMSKRCQEMIHQNYNTISAGVQHSMAIQNTGKIKYTGNNRDNQCEVSGWEKEDIVSIACGGIMTVGLKRNGTVLVATNYNGIDTDEWSNIVAIAAGYSYVVALKEDGTVVGDGHDAGDGQLNINDWKNIVAIATGWRHTVGLATDGTVYITGYRSDSQLRQISDHKADWSNIVAIAAGGGSNNPSLGKGHTVGLKSDGTVVAVGDNTFGQCNVDGWTDIVAIAAGDSHTVGLRSDGTVLITDKYQTDAELSNEWTDIVAIAAGTGYTLGLKADGTVVATGYYLQNQRPNSGEWDNIVVYDGWTNVSK